MVESVSLTWKWRKYVNRDAMWEKMDIWTIISCLFVKFIAWKSYTSVWTAGNSHDQVLVSNINRQRGWEYQMRPQQFLPEWARDVMRSKLWENSPPIYSIRPSKKYYICRGISAYIYQSKCVQMCGQNNQRQFVMNSGLCILVIRCLQNGKQFSLNDWNFRLFVGRMMSTGHDELN